MSHIIGPPGPGPYELVGIGASTSPTWFVCETHHRKGPSCVSFPYLPGHV